jgi:hypothetical protein
MVLVVLAAGCISGTQVGEAVTSTTAKVAESTTSTIKESTTTTTLEEIEEPEESTTTTIKLPTNISGCMGLTDSTQRDTCLYDIAGIGKDMSVCERITDRNIQLKCRARIEDKPEYCEEIDVLIERDWCYRNMAFRWNSIEYCRKIFYQQIKDKCIHDYVKDKKPDPFECFQIVDPKLRDDCIIQHVGLGRINPRLCYLITDPETELKCNQTYLKS